MILCSVAGILCVEVLLLSGYMQRLESACHCGIPMQLVKSHLSAQAACNVDELSNEVNTRELCAEMYKSC